MLKSEEGVILRRDDGGRWRLQVDRPHLEFLGQRVRVTGIRSGFDLLDVMAVERC